MADVKGLDSVGSKDPTHIWVSCRGKDCLIPFSILDRIFVAKEQYNLQPNEKPYLNISLQDFHKVLDILRDNITIITKKILIDICGNNSPLITHFNYLGVDNESMNKMKQEKLEKVDKAKKLRQDIKDGKVKANIICIGLEFCNSPFCTKAHKIEEFEPVACNEKNHKMCHICQCIGNPDSCRDCRDEVICKCKCGECLHVGETKEKVFRRRDRIYRSKTYLSITKQANAKMTAKLNKVKD